MSAFPDMGAYALYVWSAYGIAAAALLVLTIARVLRLRSLQSSLRCLRERKRR